MFFFFEDSLALAAFPVTLFLEENSISFHFNNIKTNFLKS